MADWTKASVVSRTETADTVACFALVTTSVTANLVVQGGTPGARKPEENTEDAGSNPVGAQT